MRMTIAGTALPSFLVSLLFLVMYLCCLLPYVIYYHTRDIAYFCWKCRTPSKQASKQANKQTNMLVHGFAAEKPFIKRRRYDMSYTSQWRYRGVNVRVSPVFCRESGQKFSNYATERRV